MILLPIKKGLHSAVKTFFNYVHTYCLLIVAATVAARR